MGLLTKIRGIVDDLLVIGKDEAVALKRNSNAIEAKTGADNAFVTMRAKELQAGFGINDLVTALDLKGLMPNIEFSFTGASAPSAGSNTNKFGFCHTTGGAYTAGDVVYDNGTSLNKLQAVNAITTTTSVTGTISLIANGYYAKESGSFVLKGDGTGVSTGVERVIELTLNFNSGTTVDSTTSIPSGAIVNRVECVVNTPFNGTSPTLAVAINGGTPLTVMAAADINLKTANQYETLVVNPVAANNAGVVRLNYTASSSSAGTAKVYVFYVSPLS